MGIRGGHSYLQTFMLVPLSSHTTARPPPGNTSLESQTQRVGRHFASNPDDDLNDATKPSRHPPVSSRHFWDTSPMGDTKSSVPILRLTCVASDGSASVAQIGPICGRVTS